MTTRRKSSPRRNGSSPFGYVIFGIVAGLGIAAAAAYYLRANSPKSAPSAPVVTQQKLSPPTPRQEPVVVQTPPASTPAPQPAPAVTQTPSVETPATEPAVTLAPPAQTPPSIAQQIGNSTPPTVEVPRTVEPVEPTPPAVAAQQTQKQPAPKAEPKPAPKEPKKEPPKQVAASKSTQKSEDQIGNLINTMSSSKKAEAEAKPVAKTTPTASTKTAPQYLQVGSFKNASEADAKRAQLLMQGFSNITISKATVNNTEFNRVRIGPFSSDASLKEAQERLKSKNINASVIR